MVMGTVTRTSGGYLSTASGTTGVNSEENSKKVQTIRDPMLGDRVAQTAEMLVLAPILKPTYKLEQYGYRPRRSALDAVNRIHELLNHGHNEVVDADLSNYFGEIPMQN